jgi:hypothetical protein
MNVYSLGFEVFMAVTMKNVVFWDVALFEFIINRHFRGTCYLHLQGRVVIKARPMASAMKEGVGCGWGGFKKDSASWEQF